MARKMRQMRFACQAFANAVVNCFSYNVTKALKVLTNFVHKIPVYYSYATGTQQLLCPVVHSLKSTFNAPI